MAIQLILCMETTKKADTDGIYITEVIRHMYQLNNQIKIITHDKLSSNTMKIHTSNILNILVKYLVRK